MASSSTLVQDDLSPDPYESRQFSPEPLDEFVLALHDYIPQQQNATCLSFRAGDKIRVLNRDPSGWWDGELDGRRGWFPSNYVNKTVTSLLDEELPKPRVSTCSYYSFMFLNQSMISVTAIQNRTVPFYLILARQALTWDLHS